MRIRPWAIACIVAMSLATVSCGTAGTDSPPDKNGAAAVDETEELYQAALEEGHLMWYTSQIPALDEATIAAFQDRYPGIEVEYLRLTSGQIATRYAGEREAGVVPADVMTTGNPEFFEKAFQDGWFIDSLDLPALEEWPDDFYADGLARSGVQPLLISYNTNLVAEADVPETWEDLLDPKWKGKMLMGDPRNVPVYVGLAQILREEFGDEFLKKLGNQDLTLVPSIVPGSQEIAAGSASILIPLTDVLTSPLVDAGAPIKLALLEPTTGLEYFTALSTESQNPNAAKLFFNFLHSQQGQIAFAGPGGASPLGAVGGGAVAIPSGYINPPYDKAASNRDEILKLLGIEG